MSTSNEIQRCDARLQRNGLASIEMVILLATVVMLTVSIVYMVGNNTQSNFENTAQVFASIQDHQSSSSSGTEDLADIKTLATTVAGSDPSFPFWVVCCFFTVITAYVFFCNSKRPKLTARKEPACQIQAFLEQSEALAKVLRKRNVIRNNLREDWLGLFEGNANVDVYMTSQIMSVRTDTSIDEVAKVIRKFGYRRLMVTDHEKRLMGIVSHKDLARKKGETAADIMTSDPKCLSPDDDIQRAITVLLQNRISCLPVVQDGKLLGVLTTSDLLMILQCVLVVLTEMKDTQIYGSQKYEAIGDRIRQSLTDSKPNDYKMQGAVV